MAALFDIPKRPDKQADFLAVQKSRTAKKSVGAIKAGNSVLTKIANIKAMVEKHLGHLKDNYAILDTVDKLHEYFKQCEKNNIVSIDTETTGLDPLIDKIVGLCLYTPEQPAAYVPINHVSYITGARADNQLTEEEVSKEFKQFLLKNPYIVMFNAKFDIRVIRNQLKVPNIWCLSFDKVPISTGYLYAAHDAQITYELYQFQKQYIRFDSPRKDMRDIANVFHNVEMPCISVVADMEDNGIEFDFNKHKELSEKYHKLLSETEIKVYSEIDKCEKQISDYRKANPNCKLESPINLASTTQISILLYDILKLDSGDKRKPRGTGSDILAKLNHPIADALVKYRELSKLITAFIDSLPKFVNPNDGRIHCSFNQYGAKTGRMSCSDPKLNWALV